MKLILSVYVGLLAAALAGCGSSGPSMSTRVSEREDATADCVKAGVQEIAAERTRVYRCSYDLLVPGRFTTPCYAMVDGDLVDVTDRADPSFSCSHVAAWKDPPTP